ncbi:MAG: Ubiquinone biosynthesis O-methyltransferase [Candidatus Anoxychlamydiales bacterium]|nr:Ubiquinone biosynthesis O-methyltransferase [Candidatus Anoxychlamydiales bacterium]
MLDNNVKVKVLTKHPVAIDSPDHKMPQGTMRDNSKNIRFNKKIYSLFNFTNPIKILDLGCSGGGFVKQSLDDGSLAIGLEGSDYSKKEKRAEWATLSDKYLFTADISKDFTIKYIDKEDQEKDLQFDLITLWDVFEHLSEKDLPQLIDNIKKHLLPSGLVIASISFSEVIINGVHLHQTVKEKKWWLELFGSNGLKHLKEYENYFNNQYIRGPKGNNAPFSFHVILSKNISLKPKKPKVSLKDYFLDHWISSKVQRKIKSFLKK